ncbi:MAG: HAMP domain-containing histidine kinase [Oscillospiraceae bacterium]|nr:HAMP domain-containing histidine kinase [Oscillospiraceae bacterium]
MRKSVFSEFFCLCAAVISAAVICVGAVMLIVSCEHYKADRIEYMQSRSEAMITATVSAVTDSGEFDFQELQKIYNDMSVYIGVDLTLTDSDGVALVCSEASPCSHTDKNIERSVLNRITEDGIFELSTLNGFYDADSFIFAQKIIINGRIYFFISVLGYNMLPNYMFHLFLTLFVTASLILAGALTIMYTSTKRLVTPIKEMTLAARRFGESDFSHKLHIADENELGYLANALNEMASSLEEIEETRKTFISNVSHELKTPMTTIGGFIDGILDGTIPKEQHTHYLKIVSKEVNRLARLVRSMLNISKYESGELALSTKDFDVLPVILQTLLNFEKRIEEKNIDIQGLDTDAVRLNADPDLAQQVIYNLVENAVKFVNNDGYIRFEFSEEEDGMQKISIRNSGEGLKAKEISKVFERFYKTDESRGIDPGGVGLGLSIVSSIIKLHGGTIRVSSEPNQFTEFSFSLKKAVNNRK